MYAPDGARPEEVTAGGGEAKRWPFVEIRELLAERGVRVPSLLADRSALGLLVLEDLGDVTLAEALAREPSRREALYRTAVRDLASMHRAMAELPNGSVIGTRAFDETLLRWELAHFVEWGLDARGIERSAAARNALDRAFDEIARELAARPRGFVHRDYQSRNLMITEADRLVVIDFQDALLGPRSYDLVALMRDSYQDLDEPFVSAMIDAYADARAFDAAERAALRDEFDRLTVQRKLKDAGRFVFIERKKGDPSFLPYVTPSLRRVRRALERLEGASPFGRVRELLAEALPADFA
jgi:aminoglycoside/choline kinase family phosphotransferase